MEEMPNPIDAIVKIRNERDRAYLASGVAAYALMLHDDRMVNNLQKFIARASGYGQNSGDIIEMLKEVYKAAVINAVMVMASPLKIEYGLTDDELTSAFALGWQQAEKFIEGGGLGKTEDVEEE